MGIFIPISILEYLKKTQTKTHSFLFITLVCFFSVSLAQAKFYQNATQLIEINNQFTSIDVSWFSPERGQGKIYTDGVTKGTRALQEPKGFSEIIWVNGQWVSQGDWVALIGSLRNMESFTMVFQWNNNSVSIQFTQKQKSCKAIRLSLTIVVLIESYQFDPNLFVQNRESGHNLT